MQGADELCSVDAPARTTGNILVTCASGQKPAWLRSLMKRPNEMLWTTKSRSVRRSSGVVMLLLAVLFAFAPAAAVAQSDHVTTPAAGTSERKAISDGLRAPIEKQLHQKVIVVVSKLSVKGVWAFAITQPKQPNGKPIDYRKTAYKNLVKPGQESGDAFSGLVIGLLRRRGGRWKTIDYSIGPSDVSYADWDRKHGAPRAIMFPSN